MLVSYAQNYEDVMLWRALRHIPNGFYIDIGANDPVFDSVTLVFYQRGWRGINVEPLQRHFLDLQRERPRDVNLLCAAGSFEGEIELLDFDVRGWATADPAAMADHRAQGRSGAAVKVPVMTLTSICQIHAPSDIHFLKIDVEGYESAVLEGIDFARFRPWIVVVEATRPNSTIHIHEQWEHRLLGANYQLAYRDGLNRYYLATEHQELAFAFEFPPNVFDDFVKASQQIAEDRALVAEELVVEAQATLKRAEEHQVRLQRHTERAKLRAVLAKLRAGEAERRAETAVLRAGHAERRAEKAELRAEHAEMQATNAEERASHIAQVAAQAQARVTALLGSTSWKITAPMRSMAGAVYALGRRSARMIGVSIRWLGSQVRARPKLKRAILAMLKPFPTASWRLRTASFGPPPARGVSAPLLDTHDPLPPRVRRIHAALTAEMARMELKGPDAYRA